MGERGVVTKVSDGSMLTVRFARTEACAKCKACTVGMSSEEMIIDAYNECKAKLGDTVNIELKSEFFLKAVFIMYFVPLIFLLAGFGGGYKAAELFAPASKEVIAFLAGLVCTAMAYLIIFKNEKRLKLKKFVPTATEIVTDKRPSL